MKTVGRFAPSPSGRMHLGNVFSAMMAWLSVRSAGGEMVLRIEDLDPDRCRPEYAGQLKRDLAWLGLDWDREQTPQSRRTEAYRAQFARLEAMGLVYPCYCTRSELHAASAPHASDGNVIYAGTCRTLTPAERAEKTRRPAWRLRVPDRDTAFRDGVQGVYRENLAHDCGDFIIRRFAGAARAAGAGLLPCAAPDRARRAAAFQAGARSGHGRAARALYAGGASGASCVSGRHLRGAGTGVCMGTFTRLFVGNRAQEKYHDHKSVKKHRMSLQTAPPHV